MRALHSIIPVLVFSALIYTSCEPFDKLSDVPKIHFKSCTLYKIYNDTLKETIQESELVFSFIDGDADFGVDFSENSEDTINFFMIPFKKTDGVYDSIDADVYGRRYTIKRQESLDRTGQNKTIKGEIKVKIQYFLDPPYDTLRYDFYIVDRAGHQSNVESSSDIGFSH